MKSKIVLAMLAVSLIGVLEASPSTNSYCAVTNDWYCGNYSNVYELAQARLVANTNDLVAAHLMVEYDISFSDFSSMSNSIVRLLRVSDAETNSVFASCYAKTRPGWVYYLDEYLPCQTNDFRIAEQQKSYLPNKRMGCSRLLKIIWDNELW